MKLNVPEMQTDKKLRQNCRPQAKHASEIPTPTTFKRVHPCHDSVRAQKLCERRGGRPGLPVPKSSYGLCGRTVTLNVQSHQTSGAV